MDEITVELQGVTKRFDDLVAVNDLSLQIKKGEFFSFLGPSGCGKTTTLRIVAGFLEADEGRVLINGQDMAYLSPNKRDIGMVYQNYALFPHMTVNQNVAFGLRMRKVDKKEIEERVQGALKTVRLEGLGDRKPTQLSGGQQQRVALARAIVIQPTLLLLDEPLSNLDAKLRKNMQIELRELQKSLGVTTIYVTHDQEEALTLSDRILVMDQGRKAQVDTPTRIYQEPADLFVANFIGKVNILEGMVETVDTEADRAIFVTDRGLRLPISGVISQATAGTKAKVAIRPECIEFAPAGDKTTPGATTTAHIRHIVYTGALTTYILELEQGHELTVEDQNIFGATAFKRGDEVHVTLAPENLYLIP
jgi:spermidine/putrescine ABC transporter ATP-binding subunit